MMYDTGYRMQDTGAECSTKIQDTGYSTNVKDIGNMMENIK